jgi:hypothetical protein
VCPQLPREAAVIARGSARLCGATPRASTASDSYQMRDGEFSRSLNALRYRWVPPANLGLTASPFRR